jgi:hypothetical protein
MIKKLSIIATTISIFLMILTPTVFAEEVLSFTDDTKDVLDATTGGKVSRPNIDIYIISCSKEGEEVELKLQLASGGNIQNKLTIYYVMDLTTDLNSYMALYSGGEIGVTDQDDNELDVISYSGVGTNELIISFNLSSSDEECTNLSAASFEFSAESEEGYYDEYPNQMEIIDVEITSPSTGIVDKSIKFKGSTTYEGSDLEWSWDFGDDETSELREPSHTYDENGTYEVSLEVFDSSGLVYGFDSVTITISPSSTPGNGDENGGSSGSGLIVFIVLIIIVVIVVVAVVFFIRRR